MPDEIETKMIRAYMEASKAQRWEPGLTGIVSLRVGIDCWNWMRSVATKEAEETLTKPWLARAWGFPVTLDRSMDPDGVIVRKDVRIP